MKNVLVYILFVVSVLSCGNSYEEQKRISRAERARLHHEDSLALKLAVMPTLDCLPLLIAKDRVMYDTASLDLRLRMFNAQMDCDTAIIGGSVEGSVSDLVRMERIKHRGLNIGYWTSTNAYWQLIANKKARVRHLSQLGDKMVSMTRYSATDFLSDMALKGVKTSSAVFRIQVNDVNIRLSMLLNNEMDAVWLTEPQASIARAAGNNVIYDSRDGHYKLGVIAFRSDLTNNVYRKNQIQELEKAYNNACDSLNKFGLKKYSDVISKYYKMTNAQVTLIPKLEFEHVKQPQVQDLKVVYTKK